jgi:hypothetical protein
VALQALDHPRLKPEPATSPPRRRWSWRRKLALELALLPAALLALELLVRAWAAARGVEPGELAAESARIASEIAGQELELALEPPEVLADHGGAAAAGERFAHPFFGWDVPWGPGRLAELARGTDDASFDVWIVGGSVAAVFFRDGSEALAEAIAADARWLGQPVVTHGLARAAYKQPQQLNLVEFALGLGGEPDLVIDLDGFNELALGTQNAEHGVHPLYPASFAWAPLMATDLADREALDGLVDLRREQRRSEELARLSRSWPFEHSAALAWVARGRMARIRTRYEAARDRFLGRQAARSSAQILAGPPYDGDFSAVLELSIRNWSESSRSLHAACAARGIAYLHVLQPTFHDPGSKIPTEAELESGATVSDLWIRAVQSGYPRLREEGERLRAEGIPFLDASQVFAGMTAQLYSDGIHFAPQGSELLAQRIAEALLGSYRR